MFRLSDMAPYAPSMTLDSPDAPPLVSPTALAAPSFERSDVAHHLVEHARRYASAALAPATRRAYDSDWRHFGRWCRHQGLLPSPADPQRIGLYLTALARGEAGGPAQSVATIARRLSALSWHYQQKGERLDRADPHIATVLAGIRRLHGRPPLQKEAVLADDLLAMIGTLDLGDLRGVRDRAMMLLGFAGGLRRSELVGLDRGPEQTEDATGWIAIEEKGLLITTRGKTGWREVEIGPGSSPLTCPVAALTNWLHLGRVRHGPLFRRILKEGRVGTDRLNDRQVARLVQKTASAAGLRADVPEGRRAALFGGHSLRAGLASSAETDERYVQRQLGHASAEMTRRYQRRRDRFRVNLTKAAGL